MCDYCGCGGCFLRPEVLKRQKHAEAVHVLQAHREGAYGKADQDTSPRDHDAERPGERHL